MDYDIRFKPAFASLFLALEPGETIVAESGAMASMDTGLTMTVSFDWKGILRALFGGESAFLNYFKNIVELNKNGNIICHTA